MMLISSLGEYTYVNMKEATSTTFKKRVNLQFQFSVKFTVWLNKILEFKFNYKVNI